MILKRKILIKVEQCAQISTRLDKCTDRTYKERRKKAGKSLSEEKKAGILTTAGKVAFLNGVLVIFTYFTYIRNIIINGNKWKNKSFLFEWIIPMPTLQNT